MRFTAALVHLEACRDTLSREGLARLLASGLEGLDLRLPSTTSGPAWQALVDLAAWTWELGGVVTVHSWEGRFDGDKSTADASEGIKDARSVVARMEALEAAVLARWRRTLHTPAVTTMLDRWRRTTHTTASPSDLEVLSAIAALSCYRGNFERDVWRGPSAGQGKRYANPQADAYLRAFVRTFKDRAPTRRLDYLGFANPDVHYVDSDRDRDGHQDDTIPPDLPAEVRRVALMVYQNTERDMRAVIARNRKPWGACPLAAFVGVGRIDKTQGQVGRLDAIARLLQDPPKGLVELVFYVGFGAETQLLKGHAGFPALVAALPTLKEACA